ncbi:hypothetical protein [Phyllobacterium ifriqiyense]|uniref:hypothetical protein n=1 Tax=Phyllobacterium ifriqiyense TaxID=314238 RepID=UPI00339495C1
MAAARMISNALMLKVRAFIAFQPPSTSTASCADPAEAYMAACMALSFFSYVSPAIYGLARTIDEQGAAHRSPRQGDEV